MKETKTFRVVFKALTTGKKCVLLIESWNVWAAYEYCKTLEIPDIYVLDEFEVF